MSKTPGIIEGYVNVRTNVTVANSIVPVHVEVSNDIGLYFGPEDTVDFGAISVTDPPQTKLVKVLRSVSPAAVAPLQRV